VSSEYTCIESSPASATTAASASISFAVRGSTPMARTGTCPTSSSAAVRSTVAVSAGVSV
jgi:hypothetical protein